MGSKNVDRLSGLPEDIQSHILSLMPTKFAVQTCVLSKRWRYTWMSITNLDFDDEPPLGFSNLETFVDRVLGFCKSSQIESLRLNFSRIRVQGSSVSNWIDKTVMLNVRELVIRLTCFKLPPSVLPSSLFTCTTITKLEIRLRNEWECPSMVSLPCLRTLDVVVSTSASAFKLIAGSPILENLSLVVGRHDSKEDYIFDIPTLKRLKFGLFYSSSSHYIKLVLRVPKLKHLLFKGKLNSFVMEDVPSLVEASFYFIGKSFATLLVELLKEISRVKLLSLKNLRSTQSQDLYLLKIISASPLQVFPNMERLELIGFWHFEVILKFLETSPELKEVYFEKLQGSPWIAPKLAPACLVAKLTTVELMIFKWRKSDIPFLKFLLGNAKVLKTLTINSRNPHIKEEKRLDPLLLNLRRASSCCEIRIHRGAAFVEYRGVEGANNHSGNYVQGCLSFLGLLFIFFYYFFIFYLFLAAVR